jgi:DNA-binding transcriptional MerR regulator
VAERAYLSIGDVLALLREEFPEVTISKIRFLESQGLLDPERTPSGYRKFYDNDVERLRFILREQREHFLPLKVIKDRLDANGGAAGVVSTGPSTSMSGLGTSQGEVTLDSGGDVAGSTVVAAAAWRAGATGVSMTRDELASASGLSVEELVELETFGLLSPQTLGGSTYYDEQGLTVANLAAAFRRYGVGARHLRMYKNSVEREAGLVEQVIMPLLKQRNPEARRRAMDAVDELCRLGEGLRGALLRSSLREHTGG